jgi:long-subunit acyl-CoA synthetase (AMP-forming)
MESNGESNKIHISEATAALLEQHGKGHWLTIRDEKVMVKGKGMMQTYWCNPKQERKTSSGYPTSSSCGSIDDISIGNFSA